VEEIPMIKKLSIVFQVIILTVVSIIGLMVLPKTSYACSCAGPSTVEEEFQRQTAVFSGKVITINKTNNGLKITFEVDQAWKGEVGKKLSVYTAMFSASCGYEFMENERYLVYAFGDMNKLQVGLCSRTKFLSTAAEDLKALDAPITISSNEKAMNDISSMTSKIYYFTFTSLLIIVIIIWLIWRRKRFEKG
jgi:hypothetical protein